MNSPFSENFVSIKELFALHALITLVTFSYKVASFDLFRFTTLRGRVEETVAEFQWICPHFSPYFSYYLYCSTIKKKQYEGFFRVIVAFLVFPQFFLSAS